MGAQSLRLAILTLMLISVASCKPNKPASQPVQTMSQSGASAVDHLVIEDLAPGAGEAVVAGEIAVVHYTGWLFDAAAPDHKGQKFDSSRDAGQPFRFPLGGGRVIRGWDEGVVGMKVGGQRRLIVPPDLGYGAQGAGGVIPPNATLIFDVELLGHDKPG